MADTLKKYLDQAGLEALVAKIKSEDDAHQAAAQAYADGLAKNYDAAGSAATAKSEAIADAEGKINALANGQVRLNKEAIETLNGSNTVEGSVAKAVKDAKDALQANIDVVDGKVNTNTEAIAAIKNAETGILKQAKDYADTEDAKIEKDLADLTTYVGTIPSSSEAENIVAYVQEKTAGIATDAALGELQAAVDAVEADVETIKGDYLKSSDKTELEGKISAVESAAGEAAGAVSALSTQHTTDVQALTGLINGKADQGALDAVSAVANAAATAEALQAEVDRATGEEARIEGLVTAEAARAAGVEAGLEERLVEVETFFKTVEGETIDQALDTLVEIQKYITDEGSAADQMVLDIAANKKAIEDHVAIDHDFAGADATLKAELEGKINAKADSSVVEGIAGRVTTAEGKITTIEGKLADIEESADANVIETVKVNGVALTPDADKAVDVTVPTGALASKDEVAEADLAEALATKLNGKADQSTLESEVATLVAADDAIKGRLDDLEAVDHEHANKAELDLIASGDKAKWDAAEAKAHEHANKAELDKFVDGDKAKLDDASTKAHVHENATVLAGISSDNITTWNTVTSKAAQSDLEAAVARVAANETAIGTINTTLADKAEADDLDAAVERIAKNETDIAANAAAIAKFQPIPTTDIDAMFQ